MTATVARWSGAVDQVLEGGVTVRLVALVVNAAVPTQLARFWAQALRWPHSSSDGVDSVLTPTDATSFDLVFRLAASEKLGQNRIHVDLTTASTSDQGETVAQLLEIGSTHIDIGQNSSDGHVVLADPEGNEFCVLEPGNRFLASCPRLGAVNCDGTHALGCFWSEALGWPLVWDHEEETAIQAPDGTGPKITWSGPPLMPRLGEERFHFHLAISPGSNAESTIDRLVALGAARATIGDACPGAIALTDVDGNKFCLVEQNTT